MADDDPGGLAAVRREGAGVAGGQGPEAGGGGEGKAGREEAEKKLKQEAAAMEWESMRAIEQKERELEAQMWAREGELYEAEMERRAEEELQQRREEEEDQQWYIQDLLMGVA